jgi:hypothetical protein
MGGLNKKGEEGTSYLMKGTLSDPQRTALLPVIVTLGQPITESGISEWWEEGKRGHRIVCSDEGDH